MTRIVSDPDSFVDDALEGLVRVHSELLARVDGGIVRRDPLGAGAVAVVIGGGSGHYPAFAGLVGRGMAAGAVCGNVFTSPSAGQAYRVGQAAQAGGGVLFSYGNYAGDVLHFDEAARMLEQAGVECRTVLVTDDIASAPIEEFDRRRGIAGDLCVFRIAGAAAEEGADLDEVERLARKANSRTRTLGVAFAGCTLPGAEAPLFTIPDGMMSVGLGIHGEPGIRDVPLQSARELAVTLLEPLLEERPDGAGDRVVLVINGLGAVKYEELFVLFRYLSDELAAQGLELVQPECGELVTSLDMAGVSATLFWLDDELERLWSAPAAAPAYRKGSVASVRARPQAPKAPPAPVASGASSSAPRAASSRATARSLAASAVAIDLIDVALEVVTEHAAELGRLDAIAGDGDHGIGMTRGLGAASSYAHAHAGAQGVDELLAGAGEAWSELAGGTSGALWGAALAALGGRLASERFEPVDLAAAVSVARQRVQQLGAAVPGDKTLVDALVPFDEAFAAAIADGSPVGDALIAAAGAATTAAQATAELSPRLGRARPLAERSVGHPDPGASSLALIVTAVAKRVAAENGEAS